MPSARTTVALGGALLVLAGCGSGGDGGPPAAARSAREARAALQDTTTGLDQALGTYREGDRDKAAAQLDAAYARHYAVARARLRVADPALARRVEDALRRTLPAAVDQGVRVSALARAIVVVEDGLALGERRLR